MNKSRRIGAIVALATAAVGMATVTATAPAVAAPQSGPQPVSNWLRAVNAHQASWVNIYWRTNSRICDVEVKVASRNLDIDYPGNRRSTSFSRGDTLRPGRTDYTAIRVDADFARAGVAKLRTAISYTDCSRRARTQWKTVNLSLPILRNSNGPGHGNPGGPGQHQGPGQQGPGQHQGPGQQGPGQQGPGQHGPGQPGGQPTTQPTRQPTMQPTMQPTGHPTMQPTVHPTMQPTGQPTSTRTRPTQMSGSPANR
ncbi:PT domain-containing protein [Micromonosporaceae bacterium Da 78-11]